MGANGTDHGHGSGATDTHEFAPDRDAIRAEVLEGLARRQKTIPSKLLYDARGSELFERICELDEYYLTRTEIAIMEEHAPDMSAELGADCLVIEYGCGAGVKTRLLLDTLDDPCAYVPIEISRDALESSATALRARYPELPILPVHADYTGDYEIPETGRPASRRVVYFPGSTFGNLQPGPAEAFLKHVGEICGTGGGMLLGIDLDKDADVLERAYNDASGITAAFELNVLERLNREIGSDFCVDLFEYEGVYEAEHSRIGMYLVSQEAQEVQIGSHSIRIDEGERILTEYSYKFTLEGLADLADRTGFGVGRVWTDPADWFGVAYLTR